MAGDSISGLKEQLEQDLATVDTQIRGNEDITRTSISSQLIAAIQDPPLIEMRQRSNDIQTVLDDIAKLLDDIQGSNIQVVLDDLQKLLADIQVLAAHGWPQTQAFRLPPNLLAELDDQVADIQVGAAVFAVPSPVLATEFRLTEGEPTPKPMPLPPS